MYIELYDGIRWTYIVTVRSLPVALYTISMLLTQDRAIMGDNCNFTYRIRSEIR